MAAAVDLDYRRHRKSNWTTDGGTDIPGLYISHHVWACSPPRSDHLYNITRQSHNDTLKPTAYRGNRPFKKGPSTLTPYFHQSPGADEFLPAV